MIDRICISINNRCNLRCSYCHFREKKTSVSAAMDVYAILRNVLDYVRHPFKIGFVGNGEPLLDYGALCGYIDFVSSSPLISTYTITNGTVGLSQDQWRFFEERGVNVGFSVDGPRDVHEQGRPGSFDAAIANAELYKQAIGRYPTFNATVGARSLGERERVVSFFEQFDTRVTFSRMIGLQGISLDDYRDFLAYAESRIPVRRGGLDCTMYGGSCGAGKNNYYFANGFVYYCGNCVDMAPLGGSDTSFFDLEASSLCFDRSKCWKEFAACE